MVSKGPKKTPGLVNLKNARPGEYSEVISKIQGHGVCPFCPEHLAQYHKLPVITRKYWLVTNSQWPYKPTKHHVLLIHREHIESFEQLSEAAWAELLQIQKETAKERGITGGVMMIRFGDTHFTGASVTHLHAHLIQSDPDSPDYATEKKVIGLATRIG